MPYTFRDLKHYLETEQVDDFGFHQFEDESPWSSIHIYYTKDECNIFSFKGPYTNRIVYGKIIYENHVNNSFVRLCNVRKDGFIDKFGGTRIDDIDTEITYDLVKRAFNPYGDQVFDILAKFIFKTKGETKMEKATNRKHSIREKNEVLKTKNVNAAAIDSEVLLIDDELLMSKKFIDKFAENIKEEREKSNIPQAVVADFMDIAQAAVSRNERINEKKMISNHLKAVRTRREYLRAFSLTYDVSPLYLIGIQHHPTPSMVDKDFIGSSDGLIDPFSFLIVMKLYDKFNKKIINIFERICFLSEEKRKNIEDLICSMPTINTYIDTKRSNLTDEFYQELNEFFNKNEKACNYKEIRSYVRSFEALRKEDEHMYYMIANLLTNISDDLKKLIADFITAAGYVSL